MTGAGRAYRGTFPPNPHITLADVELSERAAAARADRAARHRAALAREADHRRAHRGRPAPRRLREEAPGP